MKEFLKQHWGKIAIALAVIIAAVIVYALFFKKDPTTQVTVTDANGNVIAFTEAQKAEALELAERIETDLSSGWLLGNNIWGLWGRDIAAYNEMAQLSDTMFTLVCKVYAEKYNRSLINDIRDESSLPETGARGHIIAKGERLNIP